MRNNMFLMANVNPPRRQVNLTPPPKIAAQRLARRFLAYAITSVALICFVLLATAAPTFAQTGKVAWAASMVSSTTNAMHLQEYDVDTGLAIDDFIAPNPNCSTNVNPAVAVVGTKLYYTCDATGALYITDTVTHADGGTAFTLPMPPNSSTASIVWDGTGFWVLQNVTVVTGDPTTTSINQYSLTGTLLKTVNLPVPAGHSRANIP